MYVCMLLPQAEGQGAGWPPVRRPLGPVWQPGEREKGAPSIGSSRAGDHELTWLGRDSMSLLLHVLILRMFHLRFVHLRTLHV